MEWVKMRAILLKHPKVRAMADYLASRNRFVHWLTPLAGSADQDAYTYVTPSVTVRVTVASLLAFWSAANELASDGIVRHADRHTCDDLAGVPEFGEALLAVGWIEENEAEKCLILSNFHEFNTESKQRSSGAERTARYRERKRLEASQPASQEASLETSRVTPKREKKERSNRDRVTPVTLNFPQGVTETDWQAFRESRAAARKKLTARAEELAVGKLHELVRQGYDGKRLINRAIECGHLTFYAHEECRPGGPPSIVVAKPEVCPCGEPAKVRVGGRWRCAAHVRVEPTVRAAA